MMKTLHTALTLIAITAILLSGCKLTKEERRMNRATKKLEKIVSKYPELERTDTIRYPVELVTERVKVDTMFQLSTDTVTIEKDNLKVKWLVRNDTVWFDAMCDTIILRDTIIDYRETINPVKVIPSQKGKGLPWWVWVVIIGLVVALVIVAVRR